MAETATYQVVARRYRPQRFDELVGQEHVARGLSGAIESGRIGHAYLFTGARGVGKTSAARIYAKALECSAGPSSEPCNTCDACQSITAGQDVDVVEIDAASNRGVDEIRQLRQNVATRPARGRFKIYIIDEVHMLTREAFNALLKTLEEPPNHVKFVLCTTEPDKLPITILSRCQRFDFQTVGMSSITQRLAQIVEAEGVQVEPSALELIARRAGGSMRDSQSLLEQLLGAVTDRIDADDVHAVIGTGREEKIGELVAAIDSRDAAAALAALDGAVAGGADPGGVLEQLLGALRDSLLASVGCDSNMLHEGEALGVDLEAIGKKAGVETILAMLQIIDHSLARMRISGHASVLAEMAIVRLAHLENLETLSDAIETVKGSAPTPAALSRKPVASAAHAEVAPQHQREKKTPDLKASTKTKLVESTERQPHPASTPQNSGDLPENALNVWLQAAENVGGLVVDYAAEAVSARWLEHVLEVTFPSTAGHSVSFLQRPKNVNSFKESIASIVGFQVKHTLVVDKKAGEPSTDAARSGVKTKPSVPASSHSAMVKDVMNHPMVEHARRVLDAAIRKVEPPRSPSGDMETKPVSPTKEDDG